ncbi:MAG: GNAT family N-acetyltransferase [Bacteroidota bacterium]
MTIRDLQPTDDAAALALWNRSAPHDPLTAVLWREKVWDEPHPVARLGAVMEGETVGVAMGAMWEPPNETRGTVKLIGVAPEHRRRGIGGALLREVEAALAVAGAETIRVAECSPNYLVPGVDLRYTPGWLFFGKHGYENVGEAVNMHVDLRAEEWNTSAKEHRLADQGVEVRRATEADRVAVMAMLAENWPAWQPEIANTFAQDPVSLHLALRAGAVLGFSAYDANNVGTGWFGPMGTAPEARGLGIGGVLCRRCLRDLAAQGLQAATIPWVAPVGFYAHYAGAHVSRVFHRFEKRLG